MLKDSDLTFPDSHPIINCEDPVPRRSKHDIDVPIDLDLKRIKRIIYFHL